MNPPEGYRDCVVGEIFPKTYMSFCDLTQATYISTGSWAGLEVEEGDVGYYFFEKDEPVSKKPRKNTWTKNPTDIFNKIFPVRDMDFDDCQRYFTAIVARKFTQKEFTDLCKEMAKERIDAIGEE